MGGRLRANKQPAQDAAFVLCLRADHHFRGTCEAGR